MKKVHAVLSIWILLCGCAISPEPLTLAELAGQRENRLGQVTAAQEPVGGPISLYEAMARAIRYNLDYRVEMMEEALRSSELELAQYDFLPQLVANASYTGRNNFSGASSSRLLDDQVLGSQSLVASTSAERQINANNIVLSWDILDFGLSYVRAKQKADEVLIASERKRKVVARIVEDVRTAYWRAVSADRLTEKLSLLEGEIIDALEASNRAYERRNTPPLTALTYQRELLTIKEEIHYLERELIVAKQQLAALMNIDPGQPFELVLSDREESSVNFTAEPALMIEAALLNRPEIREISYRQRINKTEATASLLNLLPSLRAYGGFNYDSNDFLFNNHWAGWGVQASKNLVEAFRYPARRKTIEAQNELLEQRALALTMAIMTQVHVSLTRFEIAKRRVETTRSHHVVQDNILEQIDAGFNANRVSRQTFIREQMNDIVAEAKYDLALADLQNAFANIHASMGLDPYGVNITGDEDINSLAQKLQQHWEERGGNIVFESSDGDAEGTITFTIAGVARTFNAGDMATIPGVGTLTIAANGDFTFTPDPDYFGPIPTATYTVIDSNGGSDTGDLSFNKIANINDAPVAVDDDPVSVTEDTPATGNVIVRSDTDPNNDTLEVNNVANIKTITTDIATVQLRRLDTSMRGTAASATGVNSFAAGSGSVASEGNALAIGVNIISDEDIKSFAQKLQQHLEERGDNIVFKSPDGDEKGMINVATIQ